jgi:hypothetical protein
MRGVNGKFYGIGSIGLFGAEVAVISGTLPLQLLAEFFSG